MNKAFHLKRRVVSPHPQPELQLATTLTDSPPHLPQEILDLIVDELGLEAKRHEPVSRSTLTSCSLVSKSMSIRARGHLFSTISLWWRPYTSTPETRRTRIRALKRIMEADPLFVSFVHTFELALRDALWGTDDTEGLPGVLTMLYSSPRSGLRVLRIITPYAPLMPHRGWSDIEGAGRKALVNLFLSGCLTELVVHGPMKDAALFLAKIPKGLLSMELCKVSYPPTTPEPVVGLDVGDGEGARLEKLVVDEASAYTLFVGSAPRTRILSMMQGLKTLELEGASMSKDARDFIVVLEQCKRSLERLVWSIEPFRDQINALISRISLSSFTALRFLTFKIWTKAGLVPDTNTRRIFSVIQESAMLSLEHITFAIRVGSTRFRQGIIDDLTDPVTGWGWEMLDVALASAVQYPWLALVEIGLGKVELGPIVDRQVRHHERPLIPHRDDVPGLKRKNGNATPAPKSESGFTSAVLRAPQSHSIALGYSLVARPAPGPKL
ncbi:unnamed protein product [Cyclocybe aegerita]|uniref:DED domain-containing protein n=1 Tax=Cyclocybe aegerita TaxID=1973307 RepID=A0A8S0VRH4_CYCAE|nr:unnamed protein product [Cyclocybe aegerita]